MVCADKRRVYAKGSFATAKAAALAYDTVARRLLGAEATTNFLSTGKLNKRRLVKRGRPGLVRAGRCAAPGGRSDSPTTTPSTTGAASTPYPPTLPSPLQLLQRLLREHASANALSRPQQAVLQEGLRIIQAREQAVDTFMRELLALKDPVTRDTPLVGVDNKQHMGRLVQWFLRLVKEGVFRRLAA